VGTFIGSDGSGEAVAFGGQSTPFLLLFDEALECPSSLSIFLAFTSGELEGLSCSIPRPGG
jgi:hypothetical protein